MKRLGRKMQVSLFLFLGVCSLIINATAFLILADYHSEHYKELAKAHIEQQYSNCKQRLAVFGEQIRMFGEDAIFVGEVSERKWNEVGERMAAFSQSSNIVEMLTVYYEDNQGTLQAYQGNYGKGHIREMEPEEARQYWEMASRMGKKEIWFLREGILDGYEYLSYLIPIQKEDNVVGFLRADISAASYMRELLGESSSLWEESFSIYSENAQWYSDNFQEKELWNIDQKRSGVTIQGREMISVNALTETGDKIIQKITLKTEQLLLPAGITLLLIFLGSLFFIFFGIRMVSRTITVPLSEMQEKMKNMGNGE